MSTIKDLYKLAERVLRVPRKSAAEVALVCDLDSAYYLSDGEGMVTAYKLIMDTTRRAVPHRRALRRHAAPATGARPTCRSTRSLIFLNTTAMSDAQAALVRKLRECGQARAWCSCGRRASPGRTGLSVDRVQQATGFTVKLEPACGRRGGWS